MITYPNAQPIKGKFTGVHILSMDQFELGDLDIIYNLAVGEMKYFHEHSINGKILAGTRSYVLMYEPSTRTVESCLVALEQLGGKVRARENSQECPSHLRGKHINEVGDDVILLENSSQKKGETFEDTMLTMVAYSDLVCMRHPLVGGPARAAEIIDSMPEGVAPRKVPVINLGDGAGEHPTQAILDICTLREHFCRWHFQGLIIGDLLNGRTTRSLLKTLVKLKGSQVWLLSPPHLRLPEDDVVYLRSRGLEITLIEDISQAPRDLDFWYLLRAQIERSQDSATNREPYICITREIFELHAGVRTILIHPLPINSKDPEIESEMKWHPRAKYFTTQLRMGPLSRSALFSLVLGRVPSGWF